ncbi:hypothetical protein QN277_022997 [Acacia crassicarpa]|uniref:Patatin n=1 Tax=Acacia crassicarpa TaxID=499986 RepID=A0AAE1KCF7_9FABA|nr:hypothetical protein QN277_022997 [Acacia crassicarpa]
MASYPFLCVVSLLLTLPPYLSVATHIPKLPPPSHGTIVTILSIDGGGLRGLIPAVILRRLEAHLQELANNKHLRIADFFDVIAGTSTGGLIAEMLTAPDSNKQPLFDASQIVQFYKDEAANIFPPSTPSNLVKPKYSNDYLRHITQKMLNQTRLNDTLTNVVITAFDMKQLSPTLFSNYKLNEMPQLNALLSDIAVATSAAPTYLPPYRFENAGQQFHMIDGGVIATNPGLAALSEVTIKKRKNPEMFPMMKNPNDYTKFLLLSLGCGEAAVKNEYSAEDGDSWGALKYVFNLKTSASPLIDFMFDGNMDMSEYHLASLFQGLNAEDNYLRIQDNSLTQEMAQMDNSKPENLQNLENFGENLLKNVTKRWNVNTFKLEEVPNKVTNEVNLKRMAKILYEERKRRLERMANRKIQSRG